MAQRALESNSKLKGNDSRNISAYFNKVRPSHFPLPGQNPESPDTCDGGGLPQCCVLFDCSRYTRAF